MPHHHHGPLFSEISSCPERELLGAEILIADDDATAEARKAVASAPTVEHLLALAKALSFQQRHRDSAQVCRQILQMDPDCYAAHRRLGLNYMKTLQHEQSWKEFLWCLERSDDLLDLHYHLGLALYYQGKYDRAWFWFVSTFKMCENNDEMYVAVLYWSILSLTKMGRHDWKTFVKDVDAGHHTGYHLFVRFAAGEVSLDELDAAIPTLDLLNQTCVDYAMYVWFEQTNPALAGHYMQQMLTCSTLWGSFSFLGGYTEYLRNNTPKSNIV